MWPAAGWPFRRRAETLGVNLEALPDREREVVLGQTKPRFTSCDYPDPGFAQLVGPDALLYGAEQGLEMGAFNFLKNAVRRKILQRLLQENLPLGMRADPIFVN